MAALFMKGRQCNLMIKRSRSGCDKMVDYSEEVIRNLFIMGLTDVEHQQDIMVVEDLMLDKAVKMAAAVQELWRKETQDVLQLTASAPVM